MILNKQFIIKISNFFKIKCIVKIQNHIYLNQEQNQQKKLNPPEGHVKYDIQLVEENDYFIAYTFLLKKYKLL